MKSVYQIRVLDILQRKDMSTSELCVLVNCTQRAAQQLLAKLRRQRLVYRSGWRRQPDGIAAVFTAGQIRSRAKETQEEKEFRQARERAKKIKPRRDPLIEAFFGSYVRTETLPVHQYADSASP
jgi:transcription initiation factor IIE alpha subunit